MRYLVLVLAGLLSTATMAQAQKVDGQGQPYRGWDVDAGVGFHVTGDGDSGRSGPVRGSDWNWSWAGTVDVGHYWTSHLKSSVGVTLLQPTTEWQATPVTVEPGVQGYAYTVSDVQPTQVALAGTWQFLDNAFMHPYVSAGVRLSLLDVSARRDPVVTVWNGNVSRTYPIAPIEHDHLTVLARPFVAVGSKSYFSERTFVRPELVLALSDRGVSQVGARLAFGIDF